MILGAFGDSFLFGSDLPDIQDYDSVVWHYPSKLTYPALIAKQLQLEYYCTALPAQGNKVIADDIIRAVQYHCDNMFYIINWTWIDRFEYIGEGRVGNCEGWNSLLPGQETQHSNFYYKNFYSDSDSKLSNLMYINTALQALLDNKCKFIMTYMDHLLFDKTWHCTTSIDYLQNKIQKYTTLYDSKTFLEWSRENQYPESRHWHPLEQAHKEASEHWLPKVRTLLNTHAKEDYLHAFI
jgi:hypothetical protein